VLLTLALEGKEQLAIPKAIQRHPIKGTFDHVDLLAVRRGEKITVDVPVVVHGDVVSGALLAQDANSVSVHAEATHVPTEITLDVAGLAIGTQISAADLTLPEGVTLAGDPETLVVAITEAPTELDMEAEEGAAPAEADAGEQASADTLGEGEQATSETPAE